MPTNRTTRSAAWLGLAFAVALTVIETVHNWGDWSDPAMWIIDYLACAILYAGAYLVLGRRHAAGPGIVAAGWGFSCAMFWMAYFRMRALVLANAAPTDGDILVLNLCLGLFLWTLIGLSLSAAGLLADEEPA